MIKPIVWPQNNQIEVCPKDTKRIPNAELTKEEIKVPFKAISCLPRQVDNDENVAINVVAYKLKKNTIPKEKRIILEKYFSRRNDKMNPPITDEIRRMSVYCLSLSAS